MHVSFPLFFKLAHNVDQLERQAKLLTYAPMVFRGHQASHVP